MRIQIEMLEHKAHLGADFVQIGFGIGNVYAVHPNFAAFNFFQLVHGANQRGFTAARRPAHHHHLALVNVQIHIVNHMVTAKMLVYRFKAQHQFLGVNFVGHI